MKIGILTQPLSGNYGGLLQCYALQSVLKTFGHEVWIVQRETETQLTGLGRFFYYAKQILKTCLGGDFVRLSDPKKKEYVKKNINYFKSKYINPKTEILTTTEKLRTSHFNYKFDAYVVGSDQVWRPQYSPCITNYFLDFLSPDEKVKRIAYAASFGVEEWEFAEEETSICKELLKLFDGISVREDSAITLCEKYLERTDALHVLDPTMLLEKDDYVSLVEKENEPKSPGNLFYYILDKTEEKEKMVEAIAFQLNAVPFTQWRKKRSTYENMKNCLEDCVFPSVTAWLRAFMDAEMVITDSFHGCVFSIIFNKPFWVIGNEERGLARFNSLLSMFELRNRLIKADRIPSDLSVPIDWNKVNATRKYWQEKSSNFLKTHLNKYNG